MTAPPGVSAAMQLAWQDYLRTLEEIRRTLYAHRFAAHQRERDEAHYLFHQIQAAAFNLVIAPRPDYPRFYAHTFFDPLSYTFIGPNPDFVYSAAFLDGRRTYRICGQRSNSCMVLMQSLNSYFTLPREQMRFLGNYDLDKLQIGPGGNFEIMASATEHSGNWIRLDPGSDRNIVLVREAFSDWERQQRTPMHVEPIDDLPPRPIAHTEDEMIRRLQDAARFMKYCIDEYSQKVVEDVIALAGGVNVFAVPKFNVTHAQAGANPEATYNVLAYDITPDDALVIELDPPEPKYWGIQLTDSWDQTIDYVHHPSSLNVGQARTDADGRIRAVLSHRDPGVQNWLTPVDSWKGTLIVRWYSATRVSTPVAWRVPFDRLREHLPADTPTITPEERARQVAVRRRAALLRYNY